MFFFYQIYDELKGLNEKNARLEELLIENLKVTMKNKQREEKLNQRMSVLEEKNNELMKEFERMSITQEKTERELELCQEKNNEMLYNHHTMVTTINTLISELNYVIFILNNKNQEN